MSSRITLALLLLLGIFGLAWPSAEPRADEGMWTPLNIGAELPVEKLEKMGLKLEGPKKLYSATEDSVSDAVVQVVEFSPNGGIFGFGSAAFVSDQGLILTNHHVAFDSIAANSTPERNLVKEGFRAPTMQDELPCPNTGVRVCTTYEDVTEFVTGGIEPGLTPAQQQRAIQAAIRKVLQKSGAMGLKDAEVKVAFNGLRYYLTAYDTFRDVRLVYAPAQMIGEYGGDIDNWMWPRHTGDFTYLRAYVAPDGSRAGYSPDNVPYRARNFLTLDVGGFEPEDFCFIMGFPGRTFRGRTSFSVDYRERFLYPSRVDAFKREIARLEAEGRKDPKKGIENLARIKSLANSLKNAEGMVDGLRATGLVEEKRAEEKAFQAWVAEDAERSQRWGDIFPRLDAHYARLFNSDQLFGALRQVLAGPFMGAFPTIGALAEDATAPRPQAGPEDRKRMIESLAGPIEALGRDGQLRELTQVLTALRALPEGQKPRALFFEELDDPKAWLEKALPQPLDRAMIEALANTPPSDLSKQPVPALRLGFGLATELARLNAERVAFNAEVGPLRQRLAEAWSTWKGSLGYPDADSTLRLTYGRIRGYSPRDAITMKPWTTAEGVLEKHRGIEPFNAPGKVRELIAAKNWGRWADEKAGTLICNFLSDTDITGGNSGSPIMNGAGRMIGIAFDGNYEAMTSDYQFMPAITRTINVDIRYVLWCTELVDGMGRLIDEMKLRR
jgi:peptidase S46-like protein